MIKFSSIANEITFKAYAFIEVELFEPIRFYDLPLPSYN